MVVFILSLVSMAITLLLNKFLGFIFAVIAIIIGLTSKKKDQYTKPGIIVSAVAIVLCVFITLFQFATTAIGISKIQEENRDAVRDAASEINKSIDALGE